MQFNSTEYPCVVSGVSMFSVDDCRHNHRLCAKCILSLPIHPFNWQKNVNLHTCKFTHNYKKHLSFAFKRIGSVSNTSHGNRSCTMNQLRFSVSLFYLRHFLFYSHNNIFLVLTQKQNKNLADGVFHSVQHSWKYSNRYDDSNEL